MDCARCKDSAKGVYWHYIPGRGALEEPLCNTCENRYRTLEVAEIELLHEVGPE